MTNVISISNARAILPDLVNKVSDTLDRVTITVNGKPKVTLVSAEELESLEETAEVLAIHHTREDIAKSKEEFKKGKFITLAELLERKK